MRRVDQDGPNQQKRCGDVSANSVTKKVTGVHDPGSAGVLGTTDGNGVARRTRPCVPLV